MSWICPGNCKNKKNPRKKSLFFFEKNIQEDSKKMTSLSKKRNPTITPSPEKKQGWERFFDESDSDDNVPPQKYKNVRYIESENDSDSDTEHVPPPPSDDDDEEAPPPPPLSDDEEEAPPVPPEDEDELIPPPPPEEIDFNTEFKDEEDEFDDPYYKAKYQNVDTHSKEYDRVRGQLSNIQDQLVRIKEKLDSNNNKISNNIELTPEEEKFQYNYFQIKKNLQDDEQFAKEKLETIKQDYIREFERIERELSPFYDWQTLQQQVKNLKARQVWYF